MTDKRYSIRRPGETSYADTDDQGVAILLLKEAERLHGRGFLLVDNHKTDSTSYLSVDTDWTDADDPVLELGRKY